MKKLIAILILTIFCVASIPEPAFAYTKGKTHVKSYKKKNGTHVKAHSKSVKRKH
ncbi:MAG: hypothetical protein NC191_04540 [Muribaculaceae bacterium]|nr:hypothetical protein [Muribaculaceae bacterium]